MNQRTFPSPRPAWSKSALLDRAIQDLVRRWVGPSLLVVSAGACSAVRERDTDDDGEGGSSSMTGGSGRGGGGEAGAGMAGDGSAGSASRPDPLEPFAPDLLAEGSGFDAMHCEASMWDPMPGVMPATEHDYAALRTGSFEAPMQPPTTLSDTGTRCAGADDMDVCSAAIDIIPVEREASGCGQAGCTTFWVSTSDGDDVKQWASREDLLAFLGEIDSPEDALLVVALEGYELGHALMADPCGAAAVREVDDGFEVFGHKMTESCAPIRMTRYLLHVSLQGEVTVLGEATGSEDSACVGRRPEGLLAAEPTRAERGLGAFFAQSAHLEAAAVHAFDRMRRELRMHGAPHRLIAQAERARADEVRHAWLVGLQAERFGGEVPEVRVQPLPARSLLAIALENAVEGCARETWGAVVGTYQAAHAADPQLAALMHELAADERRHATLSFELAAWLDKRLSDAERAEVAAAYERAIAELRLQVRTQPSEPLRSLAGIPDLVTASALFDALDAQLLH